jgi:hypothetical protein
MQKTITTVILYLVCCISPLVLNAQQALNCSAQTFGDAAETIMIKGDASGNLYAANKSGFLLVKYNAAGTLLWSKPDDVSATAMSVDVDGNVFITGTLSGSVTFGSTTLTNTTPGTNNIYVVKYDTDGNVQQAFVTGESNNAYAAGIDTDASGNIFLSGSFETSTIIFSSITLTSTATVGDVFVAKLNSSGTALWARASVSTFVASACGLALDSEGSVYVAGSFVQTLKFGSNATLSNGGSQYNDIFLVKYDASGTALWSYAISSGGSYEDIAYAIVRGPNDDIFLTGYYNRSDLFVRRHNKNGVNLWEQLTYGTNSASGYDLAVDTDGNSYVAGYYWGADITLGDTTIDGNYGQWGHQLLVAKLDTDGDFVWVGSNIGEDGDEHADAICLSGTDDIYFAGSTASTVFTVGSSTLSGTTEYLAKMKRNNTVTAIHTSAKQLTNVFPNPSNGQFQLKGLEEAKWKVKVNTLNGLCIYQAELSGSNVSVDLSGQAKGIYVLELYKDDTYSGVAKIVVE